MKENNDGYQDINLEALHGNFRKVTNPIYVPNPEEMDLDQVPTLKKMLDKLHFSYIETEAELDVLKSQIVAINCAINAVERVQNKNEPINKPEK